VSAAFKVINHYCLLLQAPGLFKMLETGSGTHAQAQAKIHAQAQGEVASTRAMRTHKHRHRLDGSQLMRPGSGGQK